MDRRTTINISIRLEDLERFDRMRGGIARGEFIVQLMGVDRGLPTFEENVRNQESKTEEVLSNPYEEVEEFCARDFSGQYDIEDVKRLEAEAKGLASKHGMYVNLRDKYFFDKEVTRWLWGQ